MHHEQLLMAFLRLSILPHLFSSKLLQFVVVPLLDYNNFST